MSNSYDEEMHALETILGRVRQEKKELESELRSHKECIEAMQAELDALNTRLYFAKDSVLCAVENKINSLMKTEDKKRAVIHNAALIKVLKAIHEVRIDSDV